MILIPLMTEVELFLVRGKILIESAIDWLAYNSKQLIQL